MKNLAKFVPPISDFQVYTSSTLQKQNVKLDIILKASGHLSTKGNSLSDRIFLRNRSAEGKYTICNLLADYFSSLYRSTSLDAIEESSLNNLIISYQVNEAE